MLGKYIFPKVLESIGNDISNTVFSYIPNTAETSFYGMTEAAEEYLNGHKLKTILNGNKNISAQKLLKDPELKKWLLKTPN